MTVRWLSRHQRPYNTWLLPHSLYPGLHCGLAWCQGVQQTWPDMCIQLDPSRAWQHTKDGSNYTLWLVWISTHAIWTSECSSDVSTIHQQRIMWSRLLLWMHRWHILIASSIREEHFQYVHKVLECLAAHSLAINSAKCKLGVESLNFLGHYVSSDGIKPLEENIQAIHTFPCQLPNASSVQLRHGCNNFFCTCSNGCNLDQFKSLLLLLFFLCCYFLHIYIDKHFYYISIIQTITL